jgi:uncharacterized protein YcfJ
MYKYRHIKEGTIMKKLGLAIAACTFATTAAAEIVTGRITSVTPRYETIYENVPRTQCYDVEVPIYGTVQGGGDAAGGALAGMIIGGILGKGVSGNDDGAAAGAVIGGLIGADKGANGSRRVVTGYTTERQCEEVMVRSERNEIKNYHITFEWNNLKGSAYTYNRYRVGDRIQLEANVRAR